MVRRTQAAAAADVLGAAKRWLSDGAYVLEVRPYPEYETTTSTIDRSKMPDPGTPPDVAFPTPTKATLSNGLKVQLVERRSVPIVDLSLLLDAGFAADQSARAGTANLALAMLDEGTTTRTSEQISDALALLGAELTTASDVDASTVSLNVLKDKLDPALDLYADVVLNPAFPQKDLERIKQTTLAQIQQEKVQPIAMSLRVLPPLLYGSKHAYGTPLTGTGTEDTVKATSRADLAKFHRDWFKPNHATMVVVGDITLAELTPKLERAFSAWKAGDIPAKTISDVPPRSGTEVFLLDRPGSEQSLILSAQLAPPKRYEHEHAVIAFNDAFGGSFSARVNMNLREDKHWSYGAGSLLLDARGQRTWLIYASVQTDKTKESLQEVVKELREATSTRPLTDTELQDAKDRQTRTFAGRWETGASVAGALREILTSGLPEDYYATYSSRIRAVTINDVTQTSKEIFRPDRQVIVIVGDRAKIEAGVRELKLGEIRQLDANGVLRSATQ
jgi:zinc protease